MNKVSDILNKILNLIFIITSSVITTDIIVLNIFPNKYIILIVIILLCFNIILFYFSWVNKRKFLKILFGFITLSLVLTFTYGHFAIDKTNGFFNSLEEEKQIIEYKVLVLNNDVEFITQLKDKTIGYLEDNSIGISESINFNYDEIIVSNLSDLGYYLLNSNVTAIVVESTVLNSLYEEIALFDEITTVIDTIYIDYSPSSFINNSDYKFSLDPVVFYISGTDQYGSVDTTHGRSDVNILIVVNPISRKILLVNTPRDYYVKLHSSGELDKLTHAGIYGIDESVFTIEDLYKINIDYYMRVNFNTIVGLVDSLGGVNVYSDRSFIPWTDNNCPISKGNITLDGKCALAYSRERNVFVSGDRTRGEHQQEIISAIINKVTSSKNLLTKYDRILSVVDGEFKTNAPVDLFKEYIKYQISKIEKWDIESISADGTDDSNYTYSYGNSMKLYVMNPDYNTVNQVSSKIKEYLKK